MNIITIALWLMFGLGWAMCNINALIRADIPIPASKIISGVILGALAGPLNLGIVAHYNFDDHTVHIKVFGLTVRVSKIN